jgi:hypothetical protein
MCWQEIDRAEAAMDITIAGRYRELDARYPGSKFILTERDPEDWAKSIERFFKWLRTVYAEAENGEVCHEYADFLFAAERRVYGTSQWERPWCREKLKAGLIRHSKEVREHFASRPGSLLTMKVLEGDGWEKLCPFLGVDPLPFPFPHGGRRL